MIRIIAVLTLGLLIGPNANAQVTCTRVGDQTFCNGSLQQARPSQPRQVQPDPFGSYLGGYEAGVRRGRAQNLVKLTDIYFNGHVDPEFRDKFLADVAKNGGDVVWFRNDMAIKDQQQQSLLNSSKNSGSVATSQAEASTVAERLKKLDALLKSAAISQSEYDAKRKEILGSL